MAFRDVGGFDTDGNTYDFSASMGDVSRSRRRKKSKRTSHSRRRKGIYSKRHGRKRYIKANRRGAVRYTKKGQPYIIMSDGRARFIKGKRRK